MTENMPLTAADALKLWDSGEAVPAFQVEAKPERQTEIYAVAFALLRRGDFPASVESLPEPELIELLRELGADLSVREFHVAHSIAFAARQHGWAKMVSSHVHRDAPAITVTKPKEEEKAVAAE